MGLLLLLDQNHQYIKHSRTVAVVPGYVSTEQPEDHVQVRTHTTCKGIFMFQSYSESV